MLSARNVRLEIGGARILDGIDLDVGSDEVLAVLGPSGSGKTSLLRVIAGLETAHSGAVLWDNADLSAEAVHQRNFGLMFQDLVLFPHLNVEENVGFAVADHTQGRSRVVDALRLVGLEQLAHRSIDTLSGGEQQRVALARTLAPRPQLLMLDEPLGSLDRALRDELVGEMQRIFSDLAIPVLYVTHDQDEAFALGTRVAVMNEGRICQSGAPREVWERPADEFVARFLGFSNIVAAEGHGGNASTPWGTLPIAETATGAIRLLVRPDAFNAGGTRIVGAVTALVFRGDHHVVTIRPTAGPELEAWLRGSFSVGDRIALDIDPAGVVPI